MQRLVPDSGIEMERPGMRLPGAHPGIRRVVVAASVALAALAVFSLAGCGTDRTETTEVKVKELPLVDRQAPSSFETATFAFG
jgi:hypothetical protein